MLSAIKGPTQSRISTGIVAVVLLIACKKPSESIEEATPAERKSPPQAVGSSQEAVQQHPSSPEVVALEERTVPPVGGDVAKALVADGREIARAMDAAVTALDENRISEAKAELAKAVATFEDIHAKQPIVDITVELWRKHRELGVEELAASVDTIPLLVTVSRVDVPVYDREQIKARYEQRVGQSPDSVGNQEKLMDLQIVDSNLVYFEVDLSIAATEIAVLEAQRLLEQGKPAEAKAALLRGIGSVGVFEWIVEAPEYRARQLLWEAERAFVRRENAEAKRLLQEARDMLGPLAATNDDPQAQQMVITLLTEMKPLQGALENGGAVPEQASVFRRLELEVSGLARRAALRSMMSRRQLREGFALADALMWLENAKAEISLIPERSRSAASELELASAALASGLEAAPASDKPNFADLNARVTRLVELERATPRDHELIESELGGVILDVRMLMLDRGLMPIHRRGKAGQG
jgi:hypothetical protein